MVKVKMFVADSASELEYKINQWLGEHGSFEIKDITYRRDVRSFAQYTACVVYDGCLSKEDNNVQR